MSSLFRTLLNTASRPFNLIKNLKYSSLTGLTILPENAQRKYKYTFTEKELKDRLSPIQFYVTQEKGTERPWSGEYTTSYDEMFKQGALKEANGVFSCVVCDQELFHSTKKFESGSGWPSFYDVINNDNIYLIEDKSLGMRRIEAECSGCGSHLGHLFDDGPSPTNLRYCINAASLGFQMKKPTDRN